MKELKNTLTVFILTVAALFVVYGLGYATAHHIWKQRWNARTAEVQRDTVTVHDTLRIDAPKPDDIRKTDTLLVAVLDTIFLHRHDTVFVAAQKEVRVYSDSSYYAEVSGVQPSLDMLRIFRKTDYITTTVTKTLPAPRWSFGVVLGPTVGYGFTPVGTQPFAGIGCAVGVQYRF